MKAELLIISVVLVSQVEWRSTDSLLKNHTLQSSTGSTALVLLLYFWSSMFLHISKFHSSASSSCLVTILNPSRTTNRGCDSFFSPPNLPRGLKSNLSDFTYDGLKQHSVFKALKVMWEKWTVCTDHAAVHHPTSCVCGDQYTPSDSEKNVHEAGWLHCGVFLYVGGAAHTFLLMCGDKGTSNTCGLCMLSGNSAHCSFNIQH